MNNLSDCRADAAAGQGPSREVIARLAELLWEKEGRPAGREAEFGLQAEAVLRGTHERTAAVSHLQPHPRRLDEGVAAP